MKNLLPLVFCLFLSVVYYPCSSYAQIGAGETYYEWMSDSTYRVYFKAYFDCSGVTEPSTMPLCVSNSCATAPSTVTMNKLSVYIPPAQCSSYPTKCTSVTSSIAGYKEVVYSCTITLPSRCNSWKFAVIYSNRSSSVNLSGGGFYSETTFNNTGSYQGNSSPYFSNSAIYSNCNNVASTYNSNAIDPDGDSLATSLINVKTTSSCTTTPASITFNSASPSYSLPTNPFQCSNTFTTHATTGALSFTPSALGENSYAILVKEYRSGILIGTTTRDLRSISYTCSTPPSVSSSTPFSLTNCYLGTGGRIEACTGIPFSFSIDIKSTDPTSHFVISSNNAYATPGSTVTYSNQGQDSIHVYYLWTAPVNAASSLRNIVFTIKDSSCKAPGIFVYYYVSVPIYIWPNLTISQDTTICQGQSVSLLGGNTWSILSGTPGSLSCTTCTNPVATPTAASVYTTYTTTCPNFKDTVTIGVDSITTPTISITANPGTSITSGTSVSFTATTTNCSAPAYIWKKNGSTIPGAVTGAYTTSALTTGDIISCELTCNDHCPNPKTQTSNQLTMLVNAAGISTIAYNKELIIVPNPNNGRFILQTGNINSGSIEIHNALGQTIYSDEIHVPVKEIDLKNAPKGMYILLLKSHNYTTTSKFAIQ